VRTPARGQTVICDGREGNGQATAAANPENVSARDMRQVCRQERRAVSD
jgi:hypothetical protein